MAQYNKEYLIDIQIKDDTCSTGLEKN